MSARNTARKPTSPVATWWKFDIELDTQPRELTVPADINQALSVEPEARRHFDSLSYSRKHGLVLPIEQAKTPETRQRRIEKALLTLKEHRA